MQMYSYLGAEQCCTLRINILDTAIRVHQIEVEISISTVFMLEQHISALTSLDRFDQGKSSQSHGEMSTYCGGY